MTCHHGGLSANIVTLVKKTHQKPSFVRIHMKKTHCSTENILIYCPVCGFFKCTVAEKKTLHRVTPKVIAYPLPMEEHHTEKKGENNAIPPSGRCFRTIKNNH